MKKNLTLLFAAFLAIVLLVDCGGKNEIIEAKSYELYADQFAKFELLYPSNWFSQKFPSARFLAFSDKAVKDRFIRYDSEGPVGAKIEVLVTKLDSVITLDSVIASKIFDESVYSKPEKLTIDGVEAVHQSYEFELTDGKFRGDVYYATKDGKVATTLYFEAFGGTYEGYKPVFDTVLKSLKLAVEPKVDTIKVVTEAEPPSKTLKTVKGDGWQISIPDNFAKERGMYLGQRRGDSYIKVDVFDASKSKDLKKIVSDNAKNLRKASEPQELTINGEKAFKVAYKPSSKIDGEMYFILKNKKLYRVTLNWYKGEAELFKPIFQKCALTFKVK